MLKNYFRRYNLVFNLKNYSFKTTNVSTLTEEIDVKSFDQIPQSKHFPVVGHIYSLMKHGGPAKYHKYIDSKHKELGPIFIEQLDIKKGIFLLNPEHMKIVFRNEGSCPRHQYPDSWKFYNEIKKCKRGIFFMEGEEWRYHRSILNKVMLKDTKKYSNSCNIAALNTLNNFLEVNEKYGYIENLNHYLYKWTVDSFLAILLGSNYNESLKIQMNPLIESLVDVMENVFETSVKLTLIPIKLAYKLNLKAWINFENSLDQALLRASKLTQLSSKLIHEPNGLYLDIIKQGCSAEDAERIIVDLLLASGDTLTRTMEWILYILAKNPNYQIKLREEHLKNRQLDNITPLMKGTLRETLRLYPVAPFLNRIIQKDIVIDNYHIPAETIVLQSIYTTGRDPKYFPDPEKFWPERWFENKTRTNYLAANSFASLPFSIGLRACIGRNLAEKQIARLIYSILQCYNIELLNSNEIEPQMKLLLIPSESLKIKLTKIK